MTDKEEPKEPVAEPTEPEPTEPEKEPTEEPREEPEPKAEITPEMAELISKAIAEARKKEQEEYKAKQREWTREDRKRKQEARRERPQQDITSLSKAFAEAIKEAGGDPSRVEQISSELQKQAEIEQQRAQWEAQVEDKREDYRDRLYGAGLNPDDDNLLSLWESFDVASTVTGNFSIVDRKVESAIKKAQTQEVKVESKEKPKEEDIFSTPKGKAEIDKRALELLKEKNIDLTTDPGSPSAGDTLPETAKGKIKAGFDEIHK
jgi:hypothetical protein